MSASHARGWPAMLVVAGVALALDQASKAGLRTALAPGERIDLILGFELVRVGNDGVAFGLLGDASSALVLTITLAALALVLAWFATDASRPWLWLGVGMLVGGALGNLLDRVRAGEVTDFIDPPMWPAFNLADAAITAGVILVAMAALAPPPDASPGEP